MKIIFLDFDGVVNTLWFSPGEEKPRFFYPFDGRVNNEQAIQWLNLLCHETSAKIVITSTWRMHEHVESFLYQGGLKKDIEVIGQTPILHTTRGMEIKKYMDTCGFGIERFCILDDDSDMDEWKSHLVRCDPMIGLTFYEYQKAKKMLME